MGKTTYDVLNDLEIAGLLDDAIKKDLVHVTAIFHKQVYELFLMYSNHEKTKSGAVLSTSVEAQVSERTVWYIIKKMQS